MALSCQGNGFSAGSHEEDLREVCCLTVTKLNGANAQEVLPKIWKDYSYRNTSTVNRFLLEEHG